MERTEVEMVVLIGLVLTYMSLRWNRSVWYNELKNEKITVAYVYIIRYSSANKHVEGFQGNFSVVSLGM